MNKVFLLYVLESNSNECTHLGIFSSREKAEQAILDTCYSLSTFEDFIIDEFEFDVLED